jgi:hypothetical protein
MDDPKVWLLLFLLFIGKWHKHPEIAVYYKAWRNEEGMGSSGIGLEQVLRLGSRASFF